MGVLGKTQPTRGIFGCVCAEAASGHPTAAPPRSVMNSRRLTRPPRSTRTPEYQMADPSAEVIACIAKCRGARCRLWVSFPRAGKDFLARNVTPFSDVRLTPTCTVSSCLLQTHAPQQHVSLDDLVSALAEDGHHGLVAAMLGVLKGRHAVTIGDSFRGAGGDEGFRCCDMPWPAVTEHDSF